MRKGISCAAVAAAALLALTPALTLAADTTAASTPAATKPAVDMPSADAAKKVLAYYFHGQGMDPLLVDAKVCDGIQKDGDNKFECTTELTSPVKKGALVYFWMRFMAPQNNPAQNITVQYEFDGKVMKEKKGSIPGQLRSRTWQGYRFEKAGNWKIKILEDKDSGPVPLGSVDVTVK